MNTISAAGKQAPSAGGVAKSADAGMAAAGACGNIQSAGPAHPAGVSFCCAYWDYLRRITPDEPLAAAYGLDEKSAEVLRYQCNREFNNKVVAAARAAATFQPPSERRAP